MSQPTSPIAASGAPCLSVRDLRIALPAGADRPHAVHDISFDVMPGQVLCQPLASLGAGEQVTLRIRAKPQAAGTHQFRVEVTAADDETRLVSEGTTRFFSESGRESPAASTARQPASGGLTPGTIQR